MGRLLHRDVLAQAMYADDDISQISAPVPIWKRVLVRYLIAYQIFMPAIYAGTSVIAAVGWPSGAVAAPPEGADDGQSDGLGFLNSYNAPSVDTNNPTAGGGSTETNINLNEILPGFGAVDVFLMGSGFLSSPATLTGKGITSYNNINEKGCPVTTPVVEQTAWPVLKVKAYQRWITLDTTTGTQTVSDTQVSYSQYVSAKFPTLGKATQIKEVVVTPAVPNVSNGLVLKYELQPFARPSDGTYITYNHVDAQDPSGTQILDYGSLQNGFTTNGMVYVGMEGVVYADLVRIDRTFTAPGGSGACPLDPPSCSSFGMLNICPGSKGQYILSGTPNIFTSRLQSVPGAAQIMREIYNNPSMAAMTAEATATAGQSTHLVDGSDPVFSEVFSGCTTSTTTTSTMVPYHTPVTFTCQKWPTGLTGQQCEVQRDMHLAAPVTMPTLSVAAYARYTVTICDFYFFGCVISHDEYHNDPVSVSACQTTNMDLTAAPGPTTVGIGGNNVLDIYYFSGPTNALPGDIHNISNITSVSTTTVGTTPQWTSSFSWCMNGQSATVGTDWWSVTSNTWKNISGDCAAYEKIVADGVCGGGLTCTDDESTLGTNVDGLNFPPTAVQSAYAGYNDVLAAWSPARTSPKKCWKWDGGPLSCDLSCSFDATGVMQCLPPASICDTTVTDPTTGVATGGYKTNCCSTYPVIGPSVDTSAPLPTNPKCTFVREECNTSMVGTSSGTCYNYTDVYDCGETTMIAGPPGPATTTEVCGNTPIRCMGSECHNVPEEASVSFTKVAAATSMLNSMGADMVCAETGSVPDPKLPPPAPGTCTPTVFQGKVSMCKKPALSSVGLAPDCCDESYRAAANMTAAQVMGYVKMSYYVYKISTNVEFAEALSGAGGISKGYIDAWKTAKTGVDSVVSATQQAFTDAFNSVARRVGNEVVDQASTNTASQAFSSTYNALAANIQQGLYDIVYSIDPTIANSLFASTSSGVLSGSTAGTDMVLNTSSGSLAGGAAAILNWIYIAYMIYQILKIIGYMLYKCSNDEMQLGVNRRLGNCHLMGQSCTEWYAIGGAKLSCSVESDVYCCYKAVLPRIIMEQARGPGQLNNYGTADSPNCGGLSPTELQNVDWAKIDLTEWETTLMATGIIATSEAKSQVMNAAGEKTKFVTGGAGPIGPDGAINPGQQVVKQIGAQTTTISSTANTVGDTQPVCYDSTQPAAMAWYQGNTTGGDVISVRTGTASMVSCGVGCTEITVGTASPSQFAAGGTCTAFEQPTILNVNLPLVINSVTVTEAGFADYMDLQIDNASVWGGPYGVGVFPPTLGSYPCNLGAMTTQYPGTDVTSSFKQSGPLNVNPRVAAQVSAGGYAKFKVLWTPATQTSTSAACYGPGSVNPTTPLP